MSTVCRKAIVRGKVQGVCYRDSTRMQAEALGIHGWAKNCHDGSVEVMMCGQESAVIRLIDWLSQGPPQAVVRSVQVEDWPGQNLPSGFSTL